MGKRLYVGNLSYEMQNAELSALFAEHGRVEYADVVTDRMTGKSRGFGFVEMNSAEEAQAAMDALNGQESHGRALKVSEAKPRGSGPVNNRADFR